MESKTHFKEHRKTIEERIAEGKALRVKFPRIDQGNYKPSAKRADPVAFLEAQGKTRLKQLVPIRYARTLTSSFAFLRGGACEACSWSAARRRSCSCIFGNLRWLR